MEALVFFKPEQVCRQSRLHPDKVVQEGGLLGRHLMLTKNVRSLRKLRLKDWMKFCLISM